MVKRYGMLWHHHSTNKDNKKLLAKEKNDSSVSSDADRDPSTVRRFKTFAQFGQGKETIQPEANAI